MQKKTGAFVISLDFELHWGVRDMLSLEDYRENLLGEQQAIPAMLNLFEEFDVAATWATVGFLFARSRDEIERFKPITLPNYDNPQFSPYNEEIGETSAEDLLHYAPDLIRLIQNTPRQEIATHTYSHYYCLEAGQNKESFDADLKSAAAIAESYDVAYKSIVFPRNQHNPAYDDVLRKNGIICYRGNQKARMYQFDGKTQANVFYRTLRLLDSYFDLSGDNTISWKEIAKDKIANVPASIFLRPATKENHFLENLRFRRIARALQFAAKEKRIFHLWWHPHNFGVNLTENIEFLRRIFIVFRDLREKYGMQSLTMSQTAEMALNSESVSSATQVL